MEIRSADRTEIDRLAEIWNEGWQDAHSSIIPEDLARHRTLASFKERLEAHLDDVIVGSGEAGPIAFAITKSDELYQFYVDRAARGLGVARSLLEAAEKRIGENGHGVAWLACAIGNERAARFYEKSGWFRAGVFTSRLPTPEGIVELDVWRYEKYLERFAPPLVAVAHINENTDRMSESSEFMRKIGMRVVWEGPQVSVFEVRGGTHIILKSVDRMEESPAPFDLLVDDVFATHKRFTDLGLEPSEIEERPQIDHHIFTVREPAGNIITVFSSHPTGYPV
ncbi:MAG: GNAT family N-acetyltransferase [Pyrinomonadaceae bacterium]